jgi:hypothetical protein
MNQGYTLRFHKHSLSQEKTTKTKRNTKGKGTEGIFYFTKMYLCFEIIFL